MLQFRAIQYYEEFLCPPTNEDSILEWNTVVTLFVYLINMEWCCSVSNFHKSLTEFQRVGGEGGGLF